MRTLFRPFDWSGTAPRWAFWTVILASLLAYFVASYQSVVIPQPYAITGMSLAVLVVIQTLTWSVVVRRLHDMGRAGWWGLLLLVPIIGLIAAVWMGAARSASNETLSWPHKRRYFIAYAFAIVCLILATSRIFWAPFWIPSGSMKPNLLIGDYLVVRPVSSDVVPTAGKIYVFRHPVTDLVFVARLVGVSGDTVEMDDGQVVLNGMALPHTPTSHFAEKFEPQGPWGSVPRCANSVVGAGDICIKEQAIEIIPSGASYAVLNVGKTALDNTGRFAIPDGYLFFLGDNRDNSTDSRTPQQARGVGFVPTENLIGTPTHILFSARGPQLWQFWTWRLDRIFRPVR